MALTRAFGWTSAEAFEQHDVLELFTQLLDALDLAALGGGVGVSPASLGGGAGVSPASLFQGMLNNVLSYTAPGVFPSALHHCAMGKWPTLCTCSPLCRDGIVVTKFTKSRKLPCHFFTFFGFRGSPTRNSSTST